MKWLDLFLDIVQQLGYECEGKKLQTSQKVYVIDDCNPQLFACQTISKETRKNKKGVENGWLLQVDSENRKSIHEKYQLWYPEWMILRVKSHAKRVLRELQKKMNQQ